MSDHDDVLREDRVRDALLVLAERAPHDPDLAGTVRRAARRGRRWRVSAAAAAVVAAVAGTAIVVVTTSGPDRATDPASPAGEVSEAHAPSTCPATTPVSVVPAWARTGFSSPRPRMPLVLGDDGLIVALLFGEPLTAPRSADHENKVLWVAREDAGQPLTIEARLDPGDDPTVVELGAPGPSYLDLPSPGCWHLDLAWGDSSDSLVVRVSAP